MKVLILAYDYPPNASIGAQRPYGWYKNLKLKKIHPVVITRHWDNVIQTPLDYVKSSSSKEICYEETQYGTIIKVPHYSNFRDRFLLKHDKRYTLIRKAISLFYLFGQYFSVALCNKSAIYFAAKEYLKNGNVDFIIATGEPFVLFKYAAKLSKEFDIPWIADYRDGWTTNARFLDSSVFQKLTEKYVFRIIEKKIVKSAKYIITAADSYSIALKELHQKKVKVIFNGYHEEFFKDLKPHKGNEKLTIGYAGTIYHYQRLEVFLEGLNLFVNKHNISYEQLEVVFIGIKSNKAQLNRIISFDSSLNKYIRIIDRLPYGDTIKKLNECDVLLLLANEKIEQLYAKIFDYLALNRKILCVVNDHQIINKIITETKSGILCDNANDVVNNLENLFNEFQINGYIKNKTIGYEKYSRKNQACVLVDFLDVKEQ